MKIYENGVLREMTPEEIEIEKEIEKEMAELPPPQDEKSIMEELLDRLANVNTLSEVKEIAKDIKERI